MPSTQGLSIENKVLGVEQAKNHPEPTNSMWTDWEVSQKGNDLCLFYSIMNKDGIHVYRLFTVSNYFFYFFFFACRIIQSLNNLLMSQNECLESKANIHAAMFLLQTAFFPRAAVSFYTQACVYFWWWSCYTWNQSRGESEVRGRRGIAAGRWDFCIIPDNPFSRILVKKATYGIRQKECEGEQEGNFTGAVSDSAKLSVSFTTLPQVKSSPTPPVPHPSAGFNSNQWKLLLQGSFIPPSFGKSKSFKSQLSSDESG